MSVPGQSRHLGCVLVTSGLPLTPDISLHGNNRRYVPTADAARQGVWSAIESQRVSTRWVASSVGTTSVTR
jgi:hypothetical protein